MLVAAMAMVVASCNTSEIVQEVDPEIVPSEKTVHFTSKAISTRTAFGEATEDSEGNVIYPTYWTANDTEVKISLNYEYAVAAGVSPEDVDSEGNILNTSFDASFDGVETDAPYTFYVISPSSAMLWPSADRGAVSVYIMANQKPSATSVDETAQVIVAKSEEFSEIPDDVDVHFNHLTAYGKMTLKNISLNDGVEITSVKLISEEQPLTGSWYYKFEDKSMEAKEASESIVLDASDIDVVGGDPVWFACAPADMGGKPLKVYVNLSDGTSLYRQITLKSGLEFKSGSIYKFSVNMATAETVTNTVEATSSEEVYQLVSSTSSLSTGDQVIIVNSKSPTYAMTSTTSSSSGIAAVAKGTGWTLGSDGYIRLESSTTVLPLTVKSISGSSIVLWDGSSNYLGYSSSSSGGNSGPGGGNSRILTLSTTSQTWTVSFSSSSASLYVSGSGMSSNSKYYVRYNSNYFSLSTSSNTVALYKKTTVESTTTVDISNDQIVNYSEYGAYLSSQNLVYNSTTDQIIREYESDGATMTFAIIDPAEDQIVEFSGIPATDVTLGDSFTLSLTYISGLTTEIEETYTVYVVKEEGHTLWLTDGAGNGFIVKR